MVDPECQLEGIQKHLGEGLLTMSMKMPPQASEEASCALNICSTEDEVLLSASRDVGLSLCLLEHVVCMPLKLAHVGIWKSMEL